MSDRQPVNTAQELRDLNARAVHPAEEKPALANKDIAALEKAGFEWQKPGTKAHPELEDLIGRDLSSTRETWRRPKPANHRVHWMPNVLSEKAAAQRRRRLKDVISSQFLYAEIDTGTLEEQLETVRNLRIRPSFVIFSGGKSLHIYYMFDEPLTDLELWKRHNATLTAVVNGDPACNDVTRILAHPYARYLKQDAEGRPIEGYGRHPWVAMGGIACGASYAWEDVADVFPAEEPRKPRRTKPTGQMDLTKEALDAAYRATAVRKHGAATGEGDHATCRNNLWALDDGYERLGYTEKDTLETALQHAAGAGDSEKREIRKMMNNARKRRKETVNPITYKTLLRNAKQAGARPPRMKSPEQRPMRQTETARAPSISASTTDDSDSLRQQVREFAEPQYNLATQTWLSRGEPARFVELTAERMHREGYGRLTKEGMLNRWPKQNAIDAFKAAALENQFHPVQDYLAGLLELHRRGELEPINIGDLAARYLKALDPLSNRMMACWLVGAVKRQRRPGCKHDSMLVIQGDQGARKSSFLETLAGKEPGFFASGTETINMSKDGLLNLHRAWIHEVAELRNSQKELDSVKAFLSRPVDNFRPPYAAIAEDHPRASIFAATTNRDIFLSDPTGNRRFMVISTPCTKEHPIDTELLEAERDGIWLGALLAEREGHRNWLTAEELEGSERRNQDHMATDVDAERLESLLYPGDGLTLMPEEFTMNELLDQFGVDRDGKSCPASDAERRRLPNKLGRLLKELGYEKQQNRRDGKKAVRWVKKNEPPFKL